MATIVIKNYGSIDREIEDLGITIDASSSINLSELYDESDLMDSNDLKYLVSNSFVVVNNGIKDLSTQNGLKHINYETEYEDSLSYDIPPQDSTSIIGRIEIEHDSTTVLSDVEIINFEGNVDVQQDGNNRVTIDIQTDEIKQTGIYSLTIGDTTATITFDTPFSNSYILNGMLANTIDSTSSIYLLSVISKTTTGFIVEFSDAIDSNNYKLEWMAIERANRQSGIIALTNSSTSQSVTLNYPFSDILYSINAEISNTSDPSASIYGTVISSKSTTGFTVSFSDNIDSSNYYLEWTALK